MISGLTCLRKEEEMNIKQKLIKEFFENYIDRATGKIYLLDKAQLQPKLEQLLDDYVQQVSIEPVVKVNFADDGCICQECGRKYTMDIYVDDKLWERIKPENKAEGSGLLCGTCIIKKMESLNEFSHYNLC